MNKRTHSEEVMTYLMVVALLLLIAAAYTFLL
jgi:hypothetical protein